MKQVLVTGSNGQLGSEIKALEKQYADIQFVYTDVDELDLTNPKKIDDFFYHNTFDYCLNCAAYTAVDQAEDEFDKAMLINATAVEHLAKACKKYTTKLIHVSTDYVFDGKNYKPYLETDGTAPDSKYGLSKLAGEESVKLFSNSALILRTSWLYSLYGNNFVKTMLRLSKERKELSVVADQVGTPTYAGDLAKVMLDIVSKGEINQGTEIYHYSNEGAISWYDFAKAIFRITGIDCTVLPIESKDFPAKASRPYYSVLSKEKIKKNYKITVPYWLDSLTVVLEKFMS